ncbi:gephyrin-like molybdotransferase Glp [Truepera radiovictrix]|uniref:Molybdopterin molybdenumtransferase n=1 Tax=Truepera radiovictrix (strain DSM 17093 / CIP 108686 / LMG 22925 / RQ-24) TaxID=649638 RepID=D7CT37_TRURR|nr:gephyrin-like molybdotransferase Glp [Truepera radiovictrix]ADI15500.1 molybdenum cofactor synthesis domain protein [Truepera radiovictrix DSM 17093]WMT55949.1 molybdopterin molybdotransferase MoeA [Truepera radiovictrix]
MSAPHPKGSFRSQISVREAIAVLQTHAPTLGAETVPLTAAADRVLAEDLASRVDHPSCDNSALDGYACRAADTLGASADAPVTLRLVGDVPAGSVFDGTVGPGEAVGIYTGAPLPRGADAIIGVEFTRALGGEVALTKPASGDDVRPRAQDLRAGEVYLKRGQKLSPAALGVAAAMGYAELPVVQKPKVGILATGDEVVEPGRPIREGQVYNANGYALAALVARAGGEAVLLPHVRDDLGALEAALGRLELDLLLTSGGVSMGRYDLVRDLLFERGRVHFWKVAMKPGGPALFGHYGELPVLGLPGNPVSSLVVFELLGRAWLQRALGSLSRLPYDARVTGVAETPFRGSGFKETFARATLTFENGGYRARSTGNQSSGVLRSLLVADALAVVPPHTDILAGERLELIML